MEPKAKLSRGTRGTIKVCGPRCQRFTPTPGSVRGLEVRWLQNHREEREAERQSSRQNFYKTEHILGHKANLNGAPKIQIVWSQLLSADNKTKEE